MISQTVIPWRLFAHTAAYLCSGLSLAHMRFTTRTPVLTADDARGWLDSIHLTNPAAEDGAEADIPNLIGLRDRALIGIMAYSFARVGAVIRMKVGDYFVQGRRRWVRLHEKGGKEHDVPCHHSLDQFPDEYIAAAGIAGDVDGYLFRTAVRKAGITHQKTPSH